MDVPSPAPSTASTGPAMDVLLNTERTREAADRSSRYSRFVRLAKIALPSAAAGLFLSVLLYSALHKSVSDIKLSLGELKSLNGEVEMHNPTLTYTDTQNRAFFVNADRATQAGDGKELWNLENIRGRMAPPKGRGYKLLSDTGVLDSGNKLLDLKGSVLVVSDEGYSFKAQSAHVDIGTNHVTSEEPVQAKGGVTTINSDRFEMWDKGARLRFEGRVRFVSEAASPTRPSAPASAPAGSTSKD